MQVNSMPNYEDEPFAILELTKQDEMYLKELQPLITEHVQYIVDDFYNKLISEPTLVAIMEEHSSKESLKNTLKLYLLEMFEGEINESYLEKRKKIAFVHVELGIEEKWYLAFIQNLFRNLLNLLFKRYGTEKDLLPYINAISKIVNIEQQIVVQVYAEQSVKNKSISK